MQQFKVGTQVEFWFRGETFVGTATVREVRDSDTLIRLDTVVDHIDAIRDYHAGREYAIGGRAWTAGPSLRPTPATEYVEVNRPEFSDQGPF